MFPELDIDLLRTFVAVVESGSFTTAPRPPAAETAAANGEGNPLGRGIPPNSKKSGTEVARLPVSDHP